MSRYALLCRYFYREWSLIALFSSKGKEKSKKQLTELNLEEKKVQLDGMWVSCYYTVFFLLNILWGEILSASFVPDAFYWTVTKTLWRLFVGVIMVVITYLLDCWISAALVCLIQQIKRRRERKKGTE